MLSRCEFAAAMPSARQVTIYGQPGFSPRPKQVELVRLPPDLAPRAPADHQRMGTFASRIAVQRFTRKRASSFGKSCVPQRQELRASTGSPVSRHLPAACPRALFHARFKMAGSMNDPLAAARGGCTALTACTPVRCSHASNASRNTTISWREYLRQPSLRNTFM